MLLKEALQLSSTKIWEEMKPVNSHFKINQIREEGLTSMILKSLASSGCSSIQNIIESPKHGKESEQFLGYDFDLWIGNKNKYVRYIIQAKSQRDNYSLDSLRAYLIFHVSFTAYLVAGLPVLK